MKVIVLLFVAVMLCPSARSDGFNPADVYPGEVVFDFSTFIPNWGQINWGIEVLDTQPEGANFWGFCQGPFNPETGTAYPYCTTDNPTQVFEPAGSTFDIATDVFGFDPGITYGTQSLATPEPATWLLIASVLGVLLCVKILKR